MGKQWKDRYKVCFEGKPLTNPISIIRHACALMTHWAGQFMEIDKEALEAGANTMLKIAASLLGKKLGKNGQLLLKDGDDDNKQG